MRCVAGWREFLFIFQSKDHDMTIERMETGARMSRVVIHGDTVYLAGLTANKTSTRSPFELGDVISRCRHFGVCLK
jgi:hypothetical protein